MNPQRARMCAAVPDCVGRCLSQPSSDPLLKITSLVSGYGDVQVLWGIDLVVGRGEIVAIVGPNGAGKTTLLHTISGMIPARQGTIVFDGEDITRSAPDAIVKRQLIQVPEGR